MDSHTRGVLVIDDEPVLRVTFRHMLESNGYRVWVAEEGRRGIELCREHAPDVVITDVLMPGQDGITTIEALQREFPEIPIIAMSAVSGPAVKEFLLQLGAECCVSKPVDGAVLLRFVNDVLAERQLPVHNGNGTGNGRNHDHGHE